MPSKPRLIGTNRPRGPESPVRHEGYGGWTAKLFTTHFVEDPNYEGARRRSPFLFKDKAGKPVLDFQRYCAEENGGKAPDVVTIFLGPNDIFGAKDETIEATIAESLGSFDALIKMVRDLNEKTRIGLLLPIPPAATQDAFGASYACTQTRWQYRRNQHRMLELMLDRYADREKEGIFLVPTVGAIDKRLGVEQSDARDRVLAAIRADVSRATSASDDSVTEDPAVGR